jgi:hypothetical protein
LAVAQGSKLATFDQRIPGAIVGGGVQALERIPT